MGLAILVAGIVTGPAAAEPVALDFLPPEITPMQVCVARPADGVIVDRWTGWDGGAFFTEDFLVVKADLSRLERLDAARWRPTLEAAFAALLERDPKYTETHALLDRIELLEATGDFAEIERQRLVPRLLHGIETRSPRFQNAAARLLADGIGVPADPDRAVALLVASAYAGNADAMLQLTRRVQAGQPVPGWDVDPELAVTMAFGALVGELNATICDRIWRIAREFGNGEIVARNTGAAEAWFRFAADLGDAAAAWKVAEFHLRSEGFHKDNATLVRYLTQAADNGLPYAQVELGQLYERGAIVERDLEKARALYKAAIEPGARQGLTRYALFLETHRTDFPGHAAERVAALRELAEQPSPPGWVFSRLATYVLETDGRWAGEAEARALLERAVALGDNDALPRLARILFRQQDDPAALDRALDLLTRSATHFGAISAMNDLAGAYMCRMPDGPRLEPAATWRALEAGTDSAGPNLTIDASTIAAAGATPLEEAVLQTQALYGRPSSLAIYISHLRQTGDADAVTLAFWERYARRFDRSLGHLARISLELAATDTERRAALKVLREAARRGDSDATIRLASERLGEGGADARDEALRLLAPLAERGSGEALALMLEQSLTGGVAQRDAERALHARYAAAIEARGDFAALAFALPMLDPAQQDAYLDRMVSVVTCDFKSALRFSEALARIDRHAEARRWLHIAANLAEDTAWKLVKMGDSYRDWGGDTGRAEMMVNYRRAWKAGSPVARYRLLDRYATPGSADYDPQAAAEVFAEAFDALPDERLGTVLGRLRGSSDAVRAAVARRIDLAGPFARAAASGDVVAMREYGFFLRDRASDARSIEQAMLWIGRAARGGDAAAMFELSRAHAYGIGVPADAEAAGRWLERSAAAGYVRAVGLAAQAGLSRTPTR